jgi:hypothetical protein
LVEFWLYLSTVSTLMPNVLTNASVLIVNNSWGQFSDAEIEAVRQFVEQGGGLYMGGEEWSWDSYGSGVYPMAKLAAPYGMVWDGSYLDGPFSFLYPQIKYRLPGGTNATYSVRNAAATNAGYYSVTVRNTNGVIASDIVLLNVAEPGILVQPASFSSPLGGGGTMQVIAAGTAPFFYQWRKDRLSLPGATNSLLIMTNVQPANIGYYSVIVSNASGEVISSNAVLNLDGMNPCIWTGLVAWYPFNGNANDESVFHNHGTATGAILAPDRFGNPNKAYRFIGSSSSYIELPESSAFKSTDYTISLWFRADHWPEAQAEFSEMLISKGQNNYEITIGSPSIGPSGIRFLPRLRAPGQGDAWDAPSGSYTTNVWNHLVAVFAPSLNSVRLFLNGRELALAGPAGVLPGADLSGAARLGTRTGPGLIGSNPFLGSIDDIRIYNRGLTIQEVQQLYVYESPDTDGDGLSDAYEQGFGRYKLVPGVFTWHEAKLDAEAKGGHLATITSAREWQCIKAVLGQDVPTNSKVAWLGASDEVNEGAWRWVTGEPWEYTRWSAGEPSQPSGGGNEDFLITWTDLGDGAGWNDGGDVPPGELAGYLLEYGYYTDPTNPDTDGDGFTDGDELAAGSSPVDPSSIPPNRFNQFTLLASTPGGGIIIPDPLFAGYPSNRLVRLNATAAAGWTFLGWQGAASGEMPFQTIIMSQPQCVQAIFGTPVSHSVIGNGTIRVLPDAPIYPYGTTVDLVAVPQAGYYFVRWSNAVNGVQSPRTYTMSSANPLVTAVFASLSDGQFALTLTPDGPGHITVTPQTNRYAAGTEVTFHASPDSGQGFGGWSGDATGTQNPLTIVMDKSRVITASFSRRARLDTVRCLGQIRPGTFTLAVTGELGERYELQVSSDLTAWSTLAVVTNTLGSFELSDVPPQAQNQKFYRALLYSDK